MFANYQLKKNKSIFKKFIAVFHTFSSIILKNLSIIFGLMEKPDLH